ncbi:MAG TPA: pyridoxamine 5'-phosphate oxidase family protein [Thermoplasmata archaeon]|nr:pyridoxamine 5'-phosphate oxidase family protein [Thermoplasmata archaeon]
MVVRLESRAFAESAVRASLAHILSETAIASISTVAPGHRAHINTAFVAYTPDLEFYFISDPASTHAQNLLRNPSMALTIFRSTQRWGGNDRGAQLFGKAHRVSGAAAKTASRVYARRFPRYAQYLRGRTPQDRLLADGLRTLAFFRFAPDRVQVLDEGRFGAATFASASVRRTRR